MPVLILCIKTLLDAILPFVVQQSSGIFHGDIVPSLRCHLFLDELDKRFVEENAATKITVTLYSFADNKRLQTKDLVADEIYCATSCVTNDKMIAGLSMLATPILNLGQLMEGSFRTRAVDFLEKSRIVAKAAASGSDMKARVVSLAERFCSKPAFSAARRMRTLA